MMTDLERMSLREFMRTVIEIAWSLFVAAVVVWAIIMVTGCAVSQPGTELDRRVRAEQRMRSCMNTGGVWMTPGGNIHAGKCNWDRRVF